MENQTPKKMLLELPSHPKRGKIYELYGSQFSLKIIKTNLNSLIEDYKAITNMQVGRNDVPFAVWVEWLKLFGVPKNYQTDEALENKKTIFDDVTLVKKDPHNKI